MNEAEKYEVAWHLINDPCSARCERFDLGKIPCSNMRRSLKEVSSSAAAVKVSRRAYAQAQRELS
jgi:hypothetical protein